MNSIITYFIEANLCLLIFGLIYYLILRNDNQFHFVRYYLIAASVFAVIIPLIEFSPPFQGAFPISDFQALVLPEIVIGSEKASSTIISDSTGISTLNWILWCGGLYLTGVIIFFTLFIYQIIQIIRFISLRRADIVNKNEYFFITTNGQFPTFSFLNILFFDNSESLSPQEREKIIDHEVVHIKQRHTLDILFLEIIKIIFWINPIVWWMKTNLQDVHEYLADQRILENTDRNEYSSLLAKMALKKMTLSIGHHFNKSITLKRIKMMKSPKTKFQYWKAYSIAGIITLTTIVFSCNDEVMNDVNEVMETASQTTLPAELEGKMQDLQEKYPAAQLVYMETDAKNEESLGKLKDIDPETIALVHVFKERETIGMIVNKNGPLKAFIDEKNINADEVYQIVEQPAKPLNGYEQLYQDLSKEIKYSDEAKSKGIEGRVYVQFVVDTDGKLNNIEVVRGLGYGLDEVALTAIKEVKAFEPAMQRGKTVKQRIILPINFSLNNTEGNVMPEQAKTVNQDMSITADREGEYIKGVVKNAAGQVLPGVNIVIKDSSVGTVTDLSGAFKIKSSDPNNALVFSFIGYETKILIVK